MKRLFASRLAKLTLIVALLVGSLAGVALVSAGGPTATDTSGVGMLVRVGCVVRTRAKYEPGGAASSCRRPHIPGTL